MQNELLCMSSSPAQWQRSAEAHIQEQITFSSGDCCALTSGKKKKEKEKEVTHFQSCGSHNFPKHFFTHMKQAGGFQCLTDGFCVPIKFESLCLHSERPQHCCSWPHCQLLLLEIIHFIFLVRQSQREQPWKQTKIQWRGSSEKRNIWPLGVLREGMWKLEQLLRFHF